MLASNLFRRAFFLLLYHLYAKPKLLRNDKTTLLGFELEVPPSVFHPQLYFSSKFFAHYIQELKLDSLNVLDMGCGSGILSLVAASRGARVRSIDINPVAVHATRRNAELNELASTISVQLSNLFETIEDQEKFEYIFFNPPFYKGLPLDASETAWKGGNDYQVLRLFIPRAAHYLTPTGKVFCIFSSDMDIELLKDLFRQSCFSFQRVREKNLFFERLIIVRAEKAP
ncbi:MAG: methyltransferase [Ignavibacteriae bacterium]|nr:methyltransferase [Ignavibacteria bacterium]MBI3363670.1 methyltransferase [Ignavibacteriota bacterium]